jgi:tRNA 2-thiouridine synthesizing protein E
METIKTKARRGLPVLDSNGFLKDPDVWTPQVAQMLANEDGTGLLTERHWCIINYIREYYFQNNMAPMLRRVCRQYDIRLKELYELFPGGAAKAACKIAGLPNSYGCQ